MLRWWLKSGNSKVLGYGEKLNSANDIVREKKKGNLCLDFGYLSANKR